MKSEARDHELLQSAFLGDVKGIANALANGANVDCVGELAPYAAVTPLMLAVKAGNVAAVRLLLSRKANPNRKTRAWIPDETSRETALHWAIEGRQLAICRMLICSGADVNAESTTGSVLHYAIRFGDLRIVKLLIDAGCSVHEPSGSYKSFSIHIAAEEGQAKVIRLLCAMGARPIPHPRDGQTPLMIAARRGRADAVKVLLSLGDSVDARDKSGWTPLMHAALDGDETSVKTILRFKPDLAARSKDEKKTAWEIANEVHHYAAAYAIEKAGGKPEQEPSLPQVRYEPPIRRR
jgi:cytohesin